MKTLVLPPRSSSRARGLGLTVATLALMLLAGSMPTAAASGDPGRPVSNKSQPSPGDGDGSSPRSPVALGVSMPKARDLGVLDGFTASIGGHQPALWSVWVQWGSESTREFPTTVMSGLKDRGVVPFVFWEPWNPGDPYGTAFRYERISAGDHDAYIRRFARDAKAHGGLVMLRFAHEANNNYFPWAVDGWLENTVEQYKTAWRHIWRIFDQEAATNVRFVWSLAKATCSGGCNPYTEFYPGDQYVDYMGFSSFNWGTYGTRSWQTMYKGYERVTRLLSEISAKPIIVAETASNSEGGDKPQWIRDGYREVYDKLPRIVAILYLNYDLTKDNHPDWSLTNPPAALTAYAEIAALSAFRGKLTLKGPKASRVATKRSERHDKQRARERRAARAEEERKVDRSPKVRKGTSGSEEQVGSSTGTKAKTTRKRHKDDEPVQTMDRFDR